MNDRDKKVWDFVEANYPNYYSSDIILANSDLQVKLDEGTENFGERIELLKSNVEIYETAIEAFLATQKQTEYKYLLFGKEAVNCLMESGIDRVIMNSECSDYSIGKYELGINTEIDRMLCDFNGNHDYAVLTKDQYEQLNNL